MLRLEYRQADKKTEINYLMRFGCISRYLINIKQNQVAKSSFYLTVTINSQSI